MNRKSHSFNMFMPMALTLHLAFVVQTLPYLAMMQPFRPDKLKYD